MASAPRSGPMVPGSLRPGQTGLIHSDGRPVAPAEIARVRARAMLNVAEGSGSPGNWGAPWAYDAQAWWGQDFGEWYPFVRSPDAEINVDRDRLVGRLRDLVRNDGWASGALNTIADSAIGSTFFVDPMPNWRVLAREDRRFDGTWAGEFSEAVESAWDNYADDPGRWCDAARGMTMTQMFRTAFLHKLRDGDALAVTLWTPDCVGRGGAQYATRFELVDPDRLSNPYQMLDRDFMRGGVEIDALDAPVAYWIRRAEQNDWFRAEAAMIWDRFPRETEWGRPLVVHDFDRDRAGQHRGVGLLTAVLGRFKMLSRFDQVSLQRAVLAALIGIFVKSPYDESSVQQAMETDGASMGWYRDMREAYSADHPPMMLGGIRVPKLFQGESVEMVNGGTQLSEFEQFEHAVLRSVAAATGSTAEEVTRDYARTNYSSARAAMLTAWRTLIRRRDDFAAGFATPIYSAWLEEAVEAGAVPMPASAPDFAAYRSAYSACEWIGPGRGWVDPVKERQGELLGLDAGFGTLKETTAQISGARWRRRLEQRAIEVRTMAELRLKQPDWAGGLPGGEIDRKPMVE